MFQKKITTPTTGTPDSGNGLKSLVPPDATAALEAARKEREAALERRREELARERRSYGGCCGCGC